MIRNRLSRRGFLKLCGKAAMAAPFASLLPAHIARADDGRAHRFIVFYFPDGVAGQSQDGDASLWHATGGNSPALPSLLQPLNAFKDQCIFFNGLSMGPADNGSHPGGAKKLLTGVDGGNGQSIDQYLASTVGADRLHRHIYLGVMANHNNASGDKHISYSRAGQTVAPEDNPLRAFERLFGGSPGPAGTSNAKLDLQASVLDASRQELESYAASLGSIEKARLNTHLEALREVEARIKANAAEQTEQTADCQNPAIDSTGVDANLLYEPDHFPAMMRMQIDLMVQAMACGLSRVGVLQASHHTSELIMSRFPGTELFDPNYDMRSHQASHYGPRHNYDSREFASFVDQRQWFVQQFAYLLDSLRSRPEGDGTMLDNSTVLLCTEVSDGNTHSHDNMPFVLAGGGGGTLNSGRVLDFGYRRHGDLLAAIAHSMGDYVQGFGYESGGALEGVLM